MADWFAGLGGLELVEDGLGEEVAPTALIFGIGDADAAPLSWLGGRSVVIWIEEVED
ncbi:MAG: hypothetical protein ACKO5F_16770 [Synechococcus sp.]